MEYIDLNSKKAFVNLLADYILKHFNDDTLIEVIDCGSFLVVRGQTSITELIDLGPIKQSFLTTYPNFEIKNLNLIDIIKYNVENNSEPKWFRYYNSQRPIYSEKEILKNQKRKNKFEYPPISSISQFPHGFGLNYGRFDFYFGEYVSNHIQNITNSSQIELRYDNEHVLEDLMLKFNLDESILSDNHVFSLLLDVFYTKENINEIKSIIRNYDILNDILNPMSEKPWLIKNKIEDIIVY
jgi:hypothetical protein